MPTFRPPGRTGSNSKTRRISLVSRRRTTRRALSDDDARDRKGRNREEVQTIGTALVAKRNSRGQQMHDVARRFRPGVISSYSPARTWRTSSSRRTTSPPTFCCATSLRRVRTRSLRGRPEVPHRRRADQWHPERKTKVLDRVFINSDGAVRDARSPTECVAMCWARSPERGVHPEFTVRNHHEMVQERGQWRILTCEMRWCWTARTSSPPTGQDLYFVSPWFDARTRPAVGVHTPAVH